MMKQSQLFRLIATLLILVAVFAGSTIYANLEFRPAPYQDAVAGRNSYTYNPAVNHPTASEKDAFITQIKDFAISARSQWGIPASVIIAMAAVESGYGYTQSAHYANNLFGLKIWAYNPPGAWQLKGQPDEDGGKVRVLADYGYDRRIYDESYRRDNWYRVFPGRQAAVEYLAGTILQNSRYRSARENYQYRINNGWSYTEAAKQYCYDIAQAGFNHLGGNYYRDKIGQVMDEYNLYKYDVPTTSQVTTPVVSTDEKPWVSPIEVSPVKSDGTSVEGLVTISVKAGDDKGVKKVEFYSNDGGYLIGTRASEPYSIAWATDPWVPNGEQKLKVVVYDSTNQTVTTTRIVFVANHVPPTVGQISLSPLSGNNVWGNVKVSVNASDDKGVSKVEFYSHSGSRLIGVDTTAPYSVNWATDPWIPNGEHTLKVVVYDTDGLTAASTRTVTVANNQPPVVSSINISPVSADGYYVWRDVTISVNVTDPNGSSDIAKVEFYSADGKYLIGTDTIAPYSVVWQTYPWVPNGPQVIRVKAIDRSGNMTEVYRTVNVANK